MTQAHLLGTKPDGSVAVARLDASGALVVSGAGGSAMDPDRIEPIDGQLFSSTTTAAFTSNGVYLSRFRVEQPFRAVSVDWYPGATAVGNVAVGISTFNGTLYERKAATADGAAGTASALNSRAFAAALDLVPGVDSWRAFGLTGGTLTILRLGLVGAAGGAGNTCLVKAGVSAAGLPETIATPGAANVVPWLALTS